jgi:hypothetical protein
MVFATAGRLVRGTDIVLSDGKKLALSKP